LQSQEGIQLNAVNVVEGKKALQWWISTVVVIDALLLATGALIAFLYPAMLVSPHAEINEAARIYAGYLTSRNLTMAGLLVVALVIGARRMLLGLMLLTAFVQVMDAAMDGVEGRWAVAPGVLVLGIVFLYTASRISGHPFWRIEAWRD
jgi:hypothetical protein